MDKAQQILHIDYATQALADAKKYLNYPFALPTVVLCLTTEAARLSRLVAEDIDSTQQKTLSS